MIAVQQRLERFFARYYPDPIIFTIALTFVTFAACVVLTDTGPGEIFELWGAGLPSLLTFMAQLSLTLVFSHALANTGPVAAVLSRLARVPGSAGQAYVLVGLVGSALSLITWSLGLVGGAIIAKAVATEAGKKQVKLNYPLLVTTAYAAMCIWHMGYSSSAALFVATEGHAMQAQMGIVPMSETVFTMWNGLTILAAITAICTTALWLHSDDQATELPTDNADRKQTGDPAVSTPAEKLERSRWITLLLAAGLALYLGQNALNGTLTIDLNTVNWTLLLAVLLFTKSPRDLVEQMESAGPVVAPILLHYPFYAGMMALMIGSGLVSLLAAGVVASSTAETLPFYAFLSAGLVNIFIPSGGGQWAVQGPVFIEAATTLGTPHEQIVMAVAYGDQWTNLIQPFWALPMLAIAGLKVRQILGFCVFFLLSLGAVFAGGILIVAQTS